MALNTLVQDILWNFDILSRVSLHQTLLVVGDKLDFDQRYMQCARRTFSGDSREAILHAISKTFIHCEEILGSYQYVINNESLRILCEKMDSIHDMIWLQNEHVETGNAIFENLQHFIDRKNGVIKGLNILSTFERYNSDTAFKIELQRFVEKIEKFIRKCENMKLKMKNIYKSTLLDNVPAQEYHLSRSTMDNLRESKDKTDDNDA